MKVQGVFEFARRRPVQPAVCDHTCGGFWSMMFVPSMFVCCCGEILMQGRRRSDEEVGYRTADNAYFDDGHGPCTSYHGEFVCLLDLENVN